MATGGPTRDGDRELATGETLAAGPTPMPSETRPPHDALGETVSAERAAPLPRDPAHLPLVSPTAYARLDEIGRGGLGRIVRARDQRTGRTVAIKEMRVESSDAAVRFVREALVTANLQHPAIVPVYEVGRWPDGQPFYAMKLVTGRPLSDVIRGAGELDARLALVPHVIAVADALAYAHGEQVIHRDLKPSNVMVGGHGETVVIDWGLARREGADPDSLPPVGEAAPGETVVGSVLGTPAYMAPEQARGDRVDERADVYAIGAILYHTLGGRPPYDDSERVADLLERVRNRPPAAIASLVPGAPADLIAIVDRAMARDPEARYATAAALADDLRRFATGQLVRAHRYTRAERARRFVRRHRGALAIAACALAALAITGVISVRRVIAARDRARSAEHAEAGARVLAEQRGADARAQLAAAYLERARAELEATEPGRALALLAEAHRLGGDGPRLRMLAGLAAAARPPITEIPVQPSPGLVFGSDHDLVVTDGHDLVRWTPGHGERWRVPLARVSQLAYVDAEIFYAAIPTGVSIRAFSDGRELGRLADLPEVGDDEVIAMNWNGGDRWLALKAPHEVEVWDTERRVRIGRFAVDVEGGFAIPSPDGKRVAVGGWDAAGRADTTLRDAATGRLVATLCARPATCVGQVRPGGNMLLAVRDNPRRGGVATVFDWDGKVRQEIELREPVADLLATRDDRVIALGREGDVVARDGDGHQLWETHAPFIGYGLNMDESIATVWAFGGGKVIALDLITGSTLGRWSLPDPVLALEPSEDNQQVATFTVGERIQLWEPHLGGAITLAPTTTRIARAAWLDDHTVALGSDDGGVAIADADRGTIAQRWIGHGDRVTLVARDGDRVITASHDDAVIAWDPATGRETARWNGAGARFAMSPDRSQLAAMTSGGAITVRAMSGGVPRTLGRLGGTAMSVAWSPDGRWIAALDDHGEVGIWRASDGEMTRHVAARSDAGSTWVAFSPDSRWVFAARKGQPMLLAVEGTSDRVLAGDPETYLFTIAFSRDGTWAAGGTADGRVLVWSTASGELRSEMQSRAMVSAIVFLGDGDLMATGDLGHVIRIRDTVTGAEVVSQVAPDEIYTMTPSPDGRRLLVTTLGAALVWQMPSTDFDPATLGELARCRGGYEVRDGALVPADAPHMCD